MSAWRKRALTSAAAAAAAAVFLGVTVISSILASNPGGGPSLAAVLARTWTLPRRAQALGAELPGYLSPLPLGLRPHPFFRWRVAIQAGHWKMGEVPPEQAHLEDNTGAYAAGVHEADVNLAIARLAAEDLRRAGVEVTLLPATVPPGFDADAVVAVHADGGDGRHTGFKVASPWRSSEASRLLRDSIRWSYGLLTGMPEDRYGITYLMKGYYAFSWYRYVHAISPSTPAAIIETGFITSAPDRELLTAHPEIPARAISQGILTFLAQTAALAPAGFVPRAYPPMTVEVDQAALRKGAEDGAPAAARLAAGTVVRPFEFRNGWVDVMVWGNYRVFGWIRESDLTAGA